jgi:SHS2 domain-containing protein
MSYRYLEEIATADIAFEATGEDLEELFKDAADATVNVMIEDPQSILPRETRTIALENMHVDMLLFDLLQELIYYKDAEQLLLRVATIGIDKQDRLYRLRATARGERLDADRHEQRVDVKAVTLHRFKVETTDEGWRSLVILDI